MPIYIMAVAGIAVAAYAAKQVADNTVKIVIISGVAYVVAKKAGWL